MAKHNENNSENTHPDPFKGCVLHEALKQGKYNPDYSYPSSGLPKLRAKSVPLRSNLLRILNKE